MSEPLVLLGDAFARQQRDGVGLAIRIAGRLTSRWGPVLDLATAGGLREVYVRASQQAVLRRAIEDGPAPAVLVLGAEDSRGGGTPERVFADGLRQILALYNVRLLVIAPPCPAVSAGLRGYAKGARRWLARLPARLALDGLPGPATAVLVPTIAADQWIDQLNLRRSGIDALAEQIVAAL